MQWNLEGLRVSAVYLDTFHINGSVELSRVAYGGRVRHTVVLDRPIKIYGVDRERVIVEHEKVTAVQDNRKVDKGIV